MVIKENIEVSKNGLKMLNKLDFTDTFSTTNHFNSIEEIAELIFGSSPKWVAWLFNIRNFFVGFLGLKVAVPEDQSSSLTVGEKIKFFEVYLVKDDEIILGANDKHLNFRAIIKNYNSENYNIKVTTLVEYNNTFGKVYMNLIKPFHVLVVKRMVRKAYRK